MVGKWNKTLGDVIGLELCKILNRFLSQIDMESQLRDDLKTILNLIQPSTLTEKKDTSVKVTPFSTRVDIVKAKYQLNTLLNRSPRTYENTVATTKGQLQDISDACNSILGKLNVSENIDFKLYF